MTTGPQEQKRPASPAPSSPGSPTPPTAPTAPPAEPEDVDALLADSLRAQSEQEFTWREPERRPRWYERAELGESAPTGAAGSPSPADAVTASSASRAGRPGRRMRMGQFILGAICLLLALWCLTAVVLGVVINPLLVTLAVCAVAGLALVAAGLRPRPGARL